LLQVGTHFLFAICWAINGYEPDKSIGYPLCIHLHGLTLLSYINVIKIAFGSVYNNGSNRASNCHLKETGAANHSCLFSGYAAIDRRPLLGISIPFDVTGKRLHIKEVYFEQVQKHVQSTYFFTRT
jgi:hypothetical protein